jgi:hypothetical protein
MCNAHSMLLSFRIPLLNSEMFVRLLCQNLIERWMLNDLHWTVQNTKRTQIWQREIGSPPDMECKPEGKRQNGRSREGGMKIFQGKKKANVWCNRGTPSDLDFPLSTEAVTYFTFTLYRSSVLWISYRMAILLLRYEIACHYVSLMKLLFICQSWFSLLNILAKASSSSKFQTHIQKFFFYWNWSFFTGKHVTYETTKYLRYYSMYCISHLTWCQ